MNTIARLPLLAAACLCVTAALHAATTYERTYVEAYAGRPALPKPVAVVSPEIRSDTSATVVKVRFVVDANGTPSHISVPAGVDSDLAAALRTAVSEWKFEPASLNGKPVATPVVLPFRITSS